MEAFITIMPGLNNYDIGISQLILINTHQLIPYAKKKPIVDRLFSFI